MVTNPSFSGALKNHSFQTEDSKPFRKDVTQLLNVRDERGSKVRSVCA